MSDSTPAQQPTRNGSCLCGNIQFQLTGDPMVSVLCHCTNCKKTSGTSFQANLVFKDDIKLVDEKKFLRTFVDTDTGSGTAVHRQFCGNCGSSLFNSKAAGAMKTVASGAVEDTTGWAPTKEFFCKDRKEWLPEISGTQKLARM